MPSVLLGQVNGPVGGLVEQGRCEIGVSDVEHLVDTDLDVDIDGLMLFTLFSGVVAFTLLFVWLLLHRTHTIALDDLLASRGLDRAIAERRSEVTSSGSIGGGS